VRIFAAEEKLLFDIVDRLKRCVGGGAWRRYTPSQAHNFCDQQSVGHATFV